MATSEQLTLLSEPALPLCGPSRGSASDDAYKAGAAAASAGYIYFANPHLAGSEDHAVWLDGYKDELDTMIATQKTMKQPRQILSQRILQAVLWDLCDSKGFDDWWDNIEPSIQREVKKELQAKIEVVLTKEQNI